MTSQPRPVIWARLSTQGRGPSRTLDYEMITNAAVAIADEEGFDAVSMRKIATRIDHSTMSLYRHIGGKDDLTELMYDAVLGELDLSKRPSGDWRTELTRLARSRRQIHHRHRWISRLAQRPTLGPNGIRMLEFALAGVDELGLDIDGMLDLVSTSFHFTDGFVQGEMAEAEAQRRTGMDQVGWHLHTAPYVIQLVQAGKNPYLARLITDAQDYPDPDVVFERRLAMVLDGLAASLANRGKATEQQKRARSKPRSN